MVVLPALVQRQKQAREQAQVQEQAQELAQGQVQVQQLAIVRHKLRCQVLKCTCLHFQSTTLMRHTL